jgi:hypothetical protein
MSGFSFGRFHKASAWQTYSSFALHGRDVNTARNTRSILGVAAVISTVSACVAEPSRQETRTAAASARDAAVLDAEPADEPAKPRGPLVAHDSWEIVSAEEDPFSDRLPDAVCPDDSHMPELLGPEPVFSVDTGACTYITARQPALRDVAQGETLVARVWHFALDAGETAEAHLALRIGDTSVLDQTVPIPSEGGLIATSEVAMNAFEAGTPVFFHLHNHGDNSWSLVELSAGPKP